MWAFNFILAKKCTDLSSFLWVPREAAWRLMFWHSPCSRVLMDHALDGRLKDAQSLADGGRYVESAEAFESLFKQDPSNAEALTALAGVMAELGQPEASLALLADSVDEADPNPATLVRIADQLEEAGRSSESADFLLCALLQTPGDVNLRARTESALKSLGRLNQLEWLQSGGEGDLPLSEETTAQH